MPAAEPTLEISELFVSIQGESSHAGYPCVFIRLTGCNLRCDYCDARYTYEEPGRSYSLSAIVSYVADHPGMPVEITGGEPLLQEGIYPLMVNLLASGRRVLLETNGSLDLSRVPPGVAVIMDVKCPDSGMADRLDVANLRRLGPGGELKFVLSSRLDYDWAVGFLKDHGLLADALAGTGPYLHFSPVAGRLAATDLADWLVADALPVRLQLQLHKILWPETVRGV